jgi:hypothetical protein
MTRPCPCSHHLATRLLNQAPAWMPARLPPPAAGWTPATSSSAMPPLHARGEAFPLGLGVLAGKGVTAWQRTLASLAPAARPPAPGGPAGPPHPCLAAELISALAAVALAAAGGAPP